MEDFTEQRKPKAVPDSRPELNPAVHDFLAFEDSDDDELGAIIAQRNLKQFKTATDNMFSPSKNQVQSRNLDLDDEPIIKP